MLVTVVPSPQPIMRSTGIKDRDGYLGTQLPLLLLVPDCYISPSVEIFESLLGRAHPLVTGVPSTMCLCQYVTLTGICV